MNKFPAYISILSILIMIAVVLSGCGGGIRQRSASRLPQGCSESSLSFNGLTRWYRVCVPDPRPSEVPLVLALHGGTLSMRSFFSPLADTSASWVQIAAEQGVVLVFPNGVNPENGDTYGDDQVWNDLRPDQASGQTEVDDVGFMRSLVDKISAELPIDPERIYVTGASNGGMMTYRLLLEAPELFAAGAVFIANLPETENALPEPSHPVPIMIANSTEDPLMPYEGGIVAKDRGLVISTRETVDWWVNSNNANSAGLKTTLLPDLNPDDNCRIREEIYTESEGGAEVRLYTIIGGGHTIPALDQPGFLMRFYSRLLGPVCRDADGVMLAWDFFSSLSPDTD